MEEKMKIYKPDFGIDLIDNSIVEKITNDFITSISVEKEKLVKQRLFEQIGFELDFIKEGKRRFPRILIEQHPNMIEKYYWNDGSEHGVLLITFFMETDFSRSEDNKYFVGFKYK